MLQPLSRHVGTALFVASAIACAEGPRTPTAATPVDPVVGLYTLTVTSACTTLPENLRSRTYMATIASRAMDDYVVTLSDARFLADEQIGERAFIFHCSSSYGLGCNQFTATREGNQLRFRLAPNSERFDNEFAGEGGSIVELIPPDNSRLGISGTGLGRLDGTAIRGLIDGRVWACPARYSSFDDECASCSNASLGMTFVQR
jgi:hypothetical protein